MGKILEAEARKCARLLNNILLQGPGVKNIIYRPHFLYLRLYNFSVTSNFISFVFLENAIFKINTQKLELIYTCYRKSKDFQFMVILRSPMDHAPPYKTLNTKNLKKIAFFKSAS